MYYPDCLRLLRECTQLEECEMSIYEFDGTVPPPPKIPVTLARLHTLHLGFHTLYSDLWERITVPALVDLSIRAPPYDESPNAWGVRGHHVPFMDLLHRSNCKLTTLTLQFDLSEAASEFCAILDAQLTLEILTLRFLTPHSPTHSEIEVLATHLTTLPRLHTLQIDAHPYIAPYLVSDEGRNLPNITLHAPSEEWLQDNLASVWEAGMHNITVEKLRFFGVHERHQTLRCFASHDRYEIVEEHEDGESDESDSEDDTYWSM
ncbi:hypothetical protein C8R43DRAFT_1048820 [Mycena crocata]|nr:hypothetical protein C8R43DRAFT_1048820 [Mycena crocata]